jgi:hypothetical protein
VIFIICKGKTKKKKGALYLNPAAYMCVHTYEIYIYELRITADISTSVAKDYGIKKYHVI